MFGLYGHHKIKNNAITLIQNGITVGYRIEYELYDATLRKSQNLQKWSHEIISSVQAVLPNATVYVFRNRYRIEVPVLPTFNNVKDIGKEIASHRHIGSNVTTHNYTTWFYYFAKSKKLFRRKKQTVKVIYLV